MKIMTFEIMIREAIMATKGNGTGSGMALAMVVVVEKKLRQCQ